MNWLVDLRAMALARPGLLGPGRLVLVVGPSGAGKDTLISGARATFRDEADVVFPRRVVTRPPTAAEDNDSMTREEFARAESDGVFALMWNAHGHRYGIPNSVDDHIRLGRTAVCNVSRTVVAEARRRYAQVAVVLVTAPEHVLEQRIVSRGREGNGGLEARLKRAQAFDRSFEADFVIRNTGRPDAGVRRLVNAIRDAGVFLIT